jgi:hypothetical protein
VLGYSPQYCHFQNDVPDDGYSVGASSFQTMKFIPFFENRPTITTFFNVLQTVTSFLSDRKFVRFWPLTNSITRGVQFAASALEAWTVFVALVHAVLTA